MNFPPEIYITDLLGTFTFAAYGSYVALKKEFDIFGVSVCALLTGLGGGTIRELILGNIPFYFYDNNYIYAIILGIALAIILFRIFEKIMPYMLALDAIGLATFAFIGAARASEAHLGAFGIILLATITAVGGGLLRDIAITEIPQIFFSDFYASPAIFLGIVYSVLKNYMNKPVYVFALILCTLFLRLYAIYFKISLWKPYGKKETKIN